MKTYQVYAVIFALFGSLVFGLTAGFAIGRNLQPSAAYSTNP